MGERSIDRSIDVDVSTECAFFFLDAAVLLSRNASGKDLCAGSGWWDGQRTVRGGFKIDVSFEFSNARRRVPRPFFLKAAWKSSTNSARRYVCTVDSLSPVTDNERQLD